MKHVNSYLRVARSDVTPFDLFRCLPNPDEEIIQILGMAKVAAGEVCLKPELLRNIQKI